jgi:anti-sigma28 factor (negative regulator of flagellin synthesis)
MMSNKKRNTDAINSSNREGTNITKISNARVSNAQVSNNIDLTIDNNRVEHLKSAIGSGHFRINPYRVAEKFILFETQLTTS